MYSCDCIFFIFLLTFCKAPFDFWTLALYKISVIFVVLVLGTSVDFSKVWQNFTLILKFAISINHAVKKYSLRSWATQHRLETRIATGSFVSVTVHVSNISDLCLNELYSQRELCSQSCLFSSLNKEFWLRLRVGQTANSTIAATSMSRFVGQASTPLIAFQQPLFGC